MGPGGPFGPLLTTRGLRPLCGSGAETAAWCATIRRDTLSKTARRLYVHAGQDGDENQETPPSPASEGFSVL